MRTYNKNIFVPPYIIKNDEKSSEMKRVMQ